MMNGSPTQTAGRCVLRSEIRRKNGVVIVKLHSYIMLQMIEIGYGVPCNMIIWICLEHARDL